MPVTVDPSTLSQYPRFSLYNSPYRAHEAGRAVDLYLDSTRDAVVPSPVAGEVLETVTVDAPDRPHAVARDHLVLVDTGTHVARLLHVDPAVEAGETVAVGDPLGRTLRSGYFAPWVDDHLHLEFRPPDANPYRATGSLRIDVGVDPRPLDWDGRGVVAEAGGTYVVLDSPTGSGWTGLGCAPGAVLDGGCPHYAGGALPGADGPVSLRETRVGVAAGRDVAWDDIEVLANGRPVTGLSLFVTREADRGAKVVCPDHDFAPGDRVEVRVRRR